VRSSAPATKVVPPLLSGGGEAVVEFSLAAAPGRVESGVGGPPLFGGFGVAIDGGPVVGVTGTTPFESTVTDNEAGGTVVQGHFPPD
jgi:hypothetical protein